jgi:hypothetical protein
MWKIKKPNTYSTTTFSVQEWEAETMHTQKKATLSDGLFRLQDVGLCRKLGEYLAEFSNQSIMYGLT